MERANETIKDAWRIDRYVCMRMSIDVMNLVCFWFNMYLINMRNLINWINEVLKVWINLKGADDDVDKSPDEYFMKQYVEEISF